MLAFFAMLFSILTWSLYPLISAFGLEKVDPTDLVFWSQFLAFASALGISWGWMIKKKQKFEIIQNMKTWERKQHVFAWGAGLVSAATHLCLMYALLYTSKAGATILFETWPIIAMALTPLFVTKEWMKVHFLDYIFALLAVVGIVFVVASENRQDILAGHIFSVFHSTDPTALKGYMFAIFGSVFNALSTVLRAEVTIYFYEKVKYFRLASFMSEAVCRFTALPPVFIAMLLFSNGSTYDVMSMSLIFIIGVVILTIGSAAYTFALVKSDSPNINMAWYLMPVFALVWLHIFGVSQVTDLIAIGAVFIIAANLLLTVRADASTAYSATVLMILFGGVYCYFSTGRDLPNFYEGMSVATVFFAILVAFTWDRVLSRRQNEESLILNIVYSLQEQLDQADSKSQKFIKVIIDAVKDISTTKDRERIGHAYDDIKKAESKLEFKGRHMIFQRIDELLLSKFRNVMLTEILVLVMTGVISIYGILVFRPNDLWPDLLAVILAASIVFILFSIFDYYKDRTRTLITRSDDGLCRVNERMMQSHRRIQYTSMILMVAMLTVFTVLFHIKHGM